MALVEEIQEEIETGSTGRPLLDEIEAKAEPATPPPEKPQPAPPIKPKPKPPPKKVAKGPELAGVEFPSAKTIMDELVEQDRQERSGTPSGAVDPPAGAAPVDVGGAKPPLPVRLVKEGERPFWEPADLDLELMHAIFCGDKDWVDLAQDGATNEQILERLASSWPVFRLSVNADESGGNYGYTIASPGGVPVIWVGPYLGSHHKPSATGIGLAERVRAVLKLRWPPSAQPPAQPHISANGTGFTTPNILEQPILHSAEDKKPSRPSASSGRGRQRGRGER